MSAEWAATLWRAPPSTPETKRSYAWDGIEDVEKQRIAPAPVWLLKLIQASEQRQATPAKTPDQIAEGGRNDTLFRAGARLRRLGWSAEEIFASLTVVNNGRCKPPLPANEVRTIAESAARYSPDARANVFRPGQQPVPAVDGELPLGQADIEAAVEAAIAKNDLLGAVQLAEHIAKLPTFAQVLIKTKLKIHFGKEFPARDFERALHGLSGTPTNAQVVQMPPQGGAPASAPLGPDLLGYPLTDSGNGERIVTLFGEEIRFCIEMDKWLVWDGKRWAVDQRKVATQRAKQMARLLYTQAVGSETISKWARKSESHVAITAALKRASTEKNIPISAADLDQHSYLLNCLNGVVDLRTGALLPHEKAYLITKMCHVHYNPEAKCPRFLKFLHWAMGDNPDADMTPQTVRLIAFLQRMFGYALTGDVSEKCVFVFYGPKGNNGKTTMLTTFRTILSEYAAQISIDTLMTKTQDAGLRADMADLRGARFVTTSEVNEGQKLSEATLKYITAGMGLIKSCRKFENPIEFPATHKLIMDCNHRPKVTGSDDAVWGRLMAIEFNVRIEKDDPEFDKKLNEKLLAEAEGILAWAVRGCVRFVEAGSLDSPPEVTEANKSWREHDDLLKDFLEDCCDIDPPGIPSSEAAWVRSPELSAAYAWWCKENRERFPLGRTLFRERLMGKGFKESRSRRDSSQHQMRTWEGLQVKGDIARKASSEGMRLPLD
jgi:phage/plasmid primase, P4 family, C-terminal domain